jgi:hypothetical protein
MNDHEKRKYPRDAQLAGTPVDVIVEDRNERHIISGATLADHSGGGMKIAADMSQALARGKVVVVIINGGIFSGKKCHRGVIVWISNFPDTGRTRFGCELMLTAGPVSSVKQGYFSYNPLSWIPHLLGR